MRQRVPQKDYFGVFCVCLSNFFESDLDFRVGELWLGHVCNTLSICHQMFLYHHFTLSLFDRMLAL